MRFCVITRECLIKISLYLGEEHEKVICYRISYIQYIAQSCRIDIYVIKGKDLINFEWVRFAVSIKFLKAIHPGGTFLDGILCFTEKNFLKVYKLKRRFLKQSLLFL